MKEPGHGRYPRKGRRSDAFRFGRLEPLADHHRSSYTLTDLGTCADGTAPPTISGTSVPEGINASDHIVGSSSCDPFGFQYDFVNPVLDAEDMRALSAQPLERFVDGPNS